MGLDPDVESIALQSLGQHIEAPHEVVGDFLVSLARVVNHRRRNV